VIASINPWRYPGSKFGLRDYFAGFLQENLLVGCTLYEPFAGSASISIEMLRRELIDNAVLS
jgi:DNA adenine methylase